MGKQQCFANLKTIGSTLVPNIVDFDNNGLDDLIASYWPGNGGLLFGNSVLIWSQYEKGKFKEIILPGERFSALNDIADFNHDRMLELITACLVKYEGHNYWVYRVWNISGRNVTSVDKNFRFPRAIPFKNVGPKEIIREPVAQNTVQQLMNSYEQKRYPNAIP